jgi:hypothetical protein
MRRSASTMSARRSMSAASGIGIRIAGTSKLRGS